MQGDLMKTSSIVSLLAVILLAILIAACSPTGKKYVSMDPDQCKVIKFMCMKGMQAFVDDKGCGCKPAAIDNPTDGKLKAVDCTDPRPQACTQEYNPVCGQVQVQCIRAPCNPVMQTFGNKCEACANSFTISYTEGACADDNTAGGTVPAGTSEQQCTNMNGKYIASANECEGISQEQCTELGGTFNECASACRNDPNAQVCTMQCVPVCKFG
jgi:hypothetical protein